MVQNKFTYATSLYRIFIKCFRYNKYRVILLRNLSLTWFLIGPKYFVILSANQRTKSTEPMFHSKNYYYYIVILNVCSYSPNLFLFKYLWFHSHFSYTLITLCTHTHLYTHTYNFPHLYLFIISYTHISSHSYTHLFIHLISHIRLYTINHSLKY